MSTPESADPTKFCVATKRKLTEIEQSVNSVGEELTSGANSKNQKKTCNPQSDDNDKTDLDLFTMMENCGNPEMFDTIATEYFNNQDLQKVHLDVLEMDEDEKDSDSLSHINLEFHSELENALCEGLKPCLKLHRHENDKLKIWKPTKYSTLCELSVEKTVNKGKGVFVQKLEEKQETQESGVAIKQNELVFSETGLVDDKDSDIFAAAVLSFDLTDLHFDSQRLEKRPKVPHAWSPFPEFSVKEFNRANLISLGNRFFVGDENDSRRALFNMSSRFNHSCTPNLVRKIVEHDEDSGKCTIMFYSTRDIQFGEELCYQYSIEAGHEDSEFFTCDCGQSLVERSATNIRNRELLSKVSSEA